MAEMHSGICEMGLIQYIKQGSIYPTAQWFRASETVSWAGGFLEVSSYLIFIEICKRECLK